VASTRERIASVVDRLGIFELVLFAREKSILPSTRVALLTFHRVALPGATAGDPEVIDTSPERLDAHVGFLKRHFSFIDTGDVEAFRNGTPLPRNPVLLSFDDGYKDNFEHALPILQRHGAKASFFVASSFISERRIFWWEKIGFILGRTKVVRIRLDYPEPLDLAFGDPEAQRVARRTLLRMIKDRKGLDVDRFVAAIADACEVKWDLNEETRLANEMLMTWDEVRALKAAGMDVQSHGHRHLVTQTMTPDALRKDLIESRACIEEEVGPVRAIAYPTGRGVEGNVELRAAVEGAGFHLAFTNGGGGLRGRPVDWLNIPRMTTSLEMTESFFRGCLAFGELAYQSPTTRLVRKT
jgi:peptidoglycan/xylan/chitin deacetylase (PgdA/CDA1 family)